MLNAMRFIISYIIRFELLYYCYYSEKSKTSPKASASLSDDTKLIIIAIVVPMVVIAIVAIGLVLYCRKREFCLKMFFNYMIDNDQNQ